MSFKKILGIDYGDSRTGVSISDALGWTAQPVDTIEMKRGMDFVKKRLFEIIAVNQVETVVVGFPINMNASIGPRAEKTIEFIKNLQIYAEKLNLEIEFVKWDERLTTVIANRTMHELGIKTKNKKGLVDKIAAVQILQSYLDAKIK